MVFSLVPILFTALVLQYLFPRVAPVFSLKPLYEAYKKLEPEEKAQVGDYQRWLRRSATFYFGNRLRHLDSQDDVISFVQRPHQIYMLVDKIMLPKLRTEVKNRLNQVLYVVSDQHPLTMLVANQPSKEVKENITQNIFREDQLPDNIHRINGRAGAVLENQIKILGYTLESARMQRGKKYQVTFYYQVLKKVEKDYMVFVHGDYSITAGHRINRDHLPMRGFYPTSEWQPGEVIRDQWTLVVPLKYPFKGFTLWVGFFLGDKRLKLVNNANSDGHHRIKGPYIKVGD